MFLPFLLPVFFDLVLDFAVKLGDGWVGAGSSLSVIEVTTPVGTAGTMFMILPEGMNFLAASVRVWLKNFSPFRGQVGLCSLPS